jgi:hypothetical protein
MVWTSEELFSLEDAPFPCTKEELIEYAEHIGAPNTVIQNLQELEEEDKKCQKIYNGLEEICPYLEIPKEDTDEDY